MLVVRGLTLAGLPKRRAQELARYSITAPCDKVQTGAIFLVCAPQGLVIICSLTVMTLCLQSRYRIYDPRIFILTVCVEIDL